MSSAARKQQLAGDLVRAGLPADVVSAVLDEYEACKRRYFLGDFRPQAVDAGRFCEAVVRVIQHSSTGQHTALADELKVDAQLNRLENDTSLDDGLRLHIPRAIRSVYGFRNKRNTGHLKGGIDPNLMDATFIVGVVDWILAELIRLYHNISAQDAQALIVGVVTKQLPLIEEVDGYPVFLRKVGGREHVLALLYWTPAGRATKAQLRGWLPSGGKRSNFANYIKQLVDSQMVHVSGEEVVLLAPGRAEIQESGLLQPSS